MAFWACLILRMTGSHIVKITLRFPPTYLGPLYAGSWHREPGGHLITTMTREELLELAALWREIKAGCAAKNQEEI